MDLTKNLNTGKKYAKRGTLYTLAAVSLSSGIIGCSPMSNVYNDQINSQKHFLEKSHGVKNTKDFRINHKNRHPTKRYPDAMEITAKRNYIETSDSTMEKFIPERVRKDGPDTIEYYTNPRINEIPDTKNKNHENPLFDTTYSIRRFSINGHDFSPNNMEYEQWEVMESHFNYLIHKTQEVVRRGGCTNTELAKDGLYKSEKRSK